MTPFFRDSRSNPVQPCASDADSVNPITPPNQSHQHLNAKHASRCSSPAAAYSLAASTPSSPVVLPTTANHFISASCELSTAPGSHIPPLPTCTPLPEAHSFLDLTASSFMASFPSLSAVASFSLRLPALPRIRKHSHVAKSDATSSSSLANAQSTHIKSTTASCPQGTGNPRESLSTDHDSLADSDSRSPTPTAAVVIRALASQADVADLTPAAPPAMFAQTDADRDICETIRQLEQLAEELRAMDIEIPPPRPPTRRLVHPPPRHSSLPPARRMHVVVEEELPTSSDTRPSSTASTRGSDHTHLPLSPPTGLAYLSDTSSSDEGRGTIMPRIVLTVPSAEQLSAGYQRGVPAVDGDEMDEVQWVEEYGHWGNSSSETAGDCDSDRSSTASSLSLHGSESSSLFTSPPNSPPILTPNVSAPSSSGSLQLLTRRTGFAIQTLLPLRTLPLRLCELRHALHA